MSIDYVNKAYGLNIAYGTRVAMRTEDGWEYGTVMDASHYVLIMAEDPPKRMYRYHPTDESNLIYLNA